MSIIVIITALIIVCLIIFLILKLQKTENAQWKVEVKNKLQDIEGRANQKDIHTLKSCLIDTDILLDYCLIQLNIRGETMGERLQHARSLFSKSTYEDVWQAHKIRNKLVHEVTVNMSSHQLEENYRILRRAISEIIS